jgi:HAD superfamily hydrolase (TIGR01509 family)
MRFGVIFDFNGVIVDDYPIQKQAWDEISTLVRGKACTDEEMTDSIRGVPSRDTIARFMQDTGKNQDIDQLVKQKHDTVRDSYLASPLFCLAPGLENFLDELKRSSVPLAIATSSTKEGIEFSFKRLDLARWFKMENVIYNDGTYPCKPAPDPYIRAADALHLKPEDCIVFEDAVAGIRSAYEAGMRRVVAVGSKERLKKLTHLPGVVAGIRDFTDMGIDMLSQLS